MNIETNQEQFIMEITSFKRDLIDKLYSENVEKYRQEYKGRYSPERFKEFFLEKTVTHLIFKYLLIRMVEESMGIVTVKLNESGLKKWHEMSKNFKENYELLYEIAQSDVRREKDLSEIFKDTIYDSKEFSDRTKSVFVEYIPKLSKYDFSTLDANLTLRTIDNLLEFDNRDEIINISMESPIINFLLQQVGLK